MHQHDEEAALRARKQIGEAIDREGGVRPLAMKSKLSQATLRKIASTGVVTSHVVAASIEHATDGAVVAAMIEQPDAKGRDLYAKEPASTLLTQALRRGVSVTTLLATYGINHQDLWCYMNHDDGGSEAVRKRVAAALRHAGIEGDRT
jgi:hypothetical protein